MEGNNPLLNAKNFDFNLMLPEYFVPALEEQTRELRQFIGSLLVNKAFSWTSFVNPLEREEHKLSLLWGKISLIYMVNGTNEIQKAYEAGQKIMIDYENWYIHNRAIYSAFKKILEKDQLNKIQARILEKTLHAFELAGINLNNPERRTFEKITLALAKLSNSFANNLVEATVQTKLTIPVLNLKGLPDYFINNNLVKVPDEEDEGESVATFPMDAPHYSKIITYAEQRGIRKQAYFTYQRKNTTTTKKNPLIAFNNVKNVVAILARRAQLVKLLGYSDYAHYALVERMAKTPENSLAFLRELCEKLLPTAKKEDAKLKQFARLHRINKLEPWDLAYFQERLNKTIYDFTEEDLRPYFPLEHVLDGIFALVKSLFSIEVIECPVPNNSWHKDVRYFEIWDHGKLAGSFYLDLFTRNYKQSGAWVGELQGRTVFSGKVQNPIVYLICNFLPPQEDLPTLLTHGDVITLLHEFGHVLQHVLTKVDYSGASGTNCIPWDAVEIVSQFMENFAWIPEGLKYLAKHYQSNQDLPQSLLNKIVESRGFMAATAMLRQIEFSLLDLSLHSKKWRSWKEILSLVKEIQKETRITASSYKFNILPSFAHIFAGGYAAGYYSYKWAEVLSSDLFGRFLEEGVFDSKVGDEFYKCFLVTGGSEDPEVLFERFRGRSPQIDALLKINRIL